jgi:hypothetical protein
MVQRSNATDKLDELYETLFMTCVQSMILIYDLTTCNMNLYLSTTITICMIHFVLMLHMPKVFKLFLKAQSAQTTFESVSKIPKSTQTT